MTSDAPLPSAIRLGVRMPPCRPLPELAAFAQLAEDAGVDMLHVPDSQTLWRDAYLTLAAAASSTTKLGLATAVSNVVTRHPSVIASLLRTLDECAPRRLRLGVGVGHSSVEPIGERPSTGRELRAAVEQIRAWMSGEAVTSGESIARMQDPRPASVPVDIAATGPRNLLLAGEIADGAILLAGVAEAPLRAAIAQVHAGAEAGGRSAEAVEITVSAHTLVTDDIERDARIIKPIAASIAQRGGGGALQALGLDISVPDDIGGIRPDLVHAFDWERAVAISSAWVTDAQAVAFAEAFCLFGSGAEIADKIHAVEALGVTEVFCQHVGSWDLPFGLVDALGAEVVPRVRAGRRTSEVCA